MMKVNQKQKIVSKFKSSTLNDSSSQGTIVLRNNFHFPSTSSITSTGVMTNVLSSNVNQCQLKQFTVQLEFTLKTLLLLVLYSIKGSTKAIQSELTIALEW